MLKITMTLEDEKNITFRLDGTISGASLPDLEEVIASHRNGEKRTLLLDLSGVTFMSEEVARKLAKLENRHLKMINRSPFIETLLRIVDE